MKKQKKKLQIIDLEFFSDPYGTNFKSFYGGFEEIGLLYVVYVFEWHQQFGLYVLLGIDVKLALIFKCV